MVRLMLKLLIITNISIMNRPINCMRPVYPGEILREDFLSPLNMSVNALALALNVPATRIHEIVKERRSITNEIDPVHGSHLKQRDLLYSDT